MPGCLSRFHRWLCRALLLPAGALAGAHAAQPDWEFDPALLRGSGVSAQTIQSFNRADTLLPGLWSLQLVVNGRVIGQMDIRLAEAADGGVQPCIPHDLWLHAGVDPANMADIPGDDCPPLSAQVPGASSRIEPALLRLSLSIPQAMLRRTPHGAVPVDELDAGTSLVFFNYMGNVWHARNAAADAQTSGFLALTGGVNLGRWQYRQQGNLSGGGGRRLHWRTLGSAVQRPLPGFAGGSQLALGQLNTSGYFFSGLAYDGLVLASDTRVLSDQQRGFAPVVRGTADSNARISIRQNGREIYQTTVAPGAFVIDDLVPASYGGDLEVTVDEADGSRRRFKVPYAVLPESLRPGHWRYALAAGRTRNSTRNGVFADASYRRGLNNTFSAGAGVRVAAGYQALAADAVMLTRAGALGINLATSHSRVHAAGHHSDVGWMAGVNYSRHVAPTDTRITVATYRYSSTGWRSLDDGSGTRADSDRLPADGSAERQRARLDLNLNQPLGRWGQLFVSASRQNWHGSSRHGHQLQLGYGTTWRNGLSLNLSVMRSAASQAGSGLAVRNDTVTSLTLSLPLGRAAQSSVSTGYSHSRSGSQANADVSGSLTATSSYNLGVSHVREPRQSVWHGSLQQRLPSASAGLNASHGSGQWQVAGNLQGALVLHPGGVTLGPWLGDTFALIEARGATGAAVGGSGQARIGRNGYALMPSLMPYRYNRVFLDPQGTADAVELDTGEQRVAPYAGAAVKLHFNTRSGQALLIHVQAPGGLSLPMGTRALDTDGRSVGLLGQGNWLYLRSETPRGQLLLRWGERADEQCHLRYDTGQPPQADILRLQAACTHEGMTP